MSTVDEDRQASDTDMLFLSFVDTGEADPFLICYTANKTFYRHGLVLQFIDFFDDLLGIKVMHH